MPDTTTAESTDTAVESDAPLSNPFDAYRDSTPPDSGAVEATPAVAESEPVPAPSTTDQPTTPKPLENPLTAALAQPEPVLPVAKPDPYAALPPEIQSLLKDPAAHAAKLKHWSNLESLSGRQFQEVGQLRQQLQQYQGIDPQQARAVLAEREQAAKQANLNPWNRGHPAHSDFRSIRELRRRDDQRLASVAPEQREAVRAALDAAYSPEEQAQLKAYDAYRHREEVMSPEDREDRMNEQIDARVTAGIERAMQYADNTRRTQDFIAKNPTLLNENQDLLRRAMDPATPRSGLAAEILALQEQVRQATGQRAKDVRVVETAKARDQIVKQTAVIGRDGHAGQRRADPMKVARDAAAAGESPLQALARMQADTQSTES